MTTIDHQQAAVENAAKAIFCMQHRLSEKAFTTATYRLLAEAATHEAANALTAATPHLRASVAEEVRALIADKPKNPHMYNPWEDSSVDPTNLDEVVGAAVSRGWGSGYYEGVQAALALLEGGGQ